MAARKRKTRRQRTLGVTEFKSHCLALVDELQRQGGEIVLTRRGKRVAKVTPLVDERAPTLRGLFKGRLQIDDDIAELSFTELWETR
jgi:antitoxin (DNA-binding transcriptional repressor) of toxin-antitoxin stability system